MKSLLFTEAIWKLKLPILQAGGEAQTRRLEPSLEEVNKEPDAWEHGTDGTFWLFYNRFTHAKIAIKPRHHVGEIAYVPEAWWTYLGSDTPHYLSDERPPHRLGQFGTIHSARSTHSSRSMPAWAARWFVQFGPPVPQRVQEITPEDCLAEGVVSHLREHDARVDLRQQFARMWDAAYPRQPFRSNPWEMTYRFRLVGRPDGL